MLLRELIIHAAWTITQFRAIIWEMTPCKGYIRVANVLTKVVIACEDAVK